MDIEIPKKDPSSHRSQRSPKYRKAYSKLSEYVTTILAAHKIKATKAIFWKKGISSFVFRIEGKRIFALKISPVYPLQTQLYFFEHGRRAGIPVPKIVISDLSKKLIPHDFYITDWAEGISADDLGKKDLYDCAYQVGRIFAKFRTIHPEGYGFQKQDTTWAYHAWPKALRDFIYRETSKQYIAKSFGKEMARITDAIIKDKRMNIVRPSLIHGDAGADQMIVKQVAEKWKIKAVLDPSDYVSGDPMLDIASALITWNQKEYGSGFYDGYISAHPLDAEEQYRLPRLIFLNQIWAAALIIPGNKKKGIALGNEAKRLAKGLAY